jgi:hypothetical protein
MAVIGFLADLGLVGGGRERPDAHTSARECAHMVVLFVVINLPESVVVL